MADYDKTEAPTPKRREDARRKGEVARSVEVSSAMAIVAAFGILHVFGGTMFEQIRSFMLTVFQPGAMGACSEGSVTDYMSMASSTFIGVMTPVMFGLVLTGVAVNMAQTKMLFSTQTLKPNLSKLNPLAGLKRMFSMRSLFELLKAMGKMSICGFLGYQILADKYASLVLLENASIVTSVGIVAGIAVEMGFKIGAALILIAVADYLYQRHTFESKLRMSHAELKEELRSAEGDPQLKARIKQQQRQWARRRMMQDVPNADVVVTNPTHLAVAIKYDASRAAAPIVVAKGELLIAEQIKKVAKAHGVPVIENKPLAQALHKMVEIGDQIPANLYMAVAELLAFIYHLKRPGPQPTT